MSTNLRMRVRIRHLGFVGTALLTFGCLKLQSSEKSESEACTACHGEGTRAGTPLEKAAPPRDLDGNRSTSQRGVGAHERHLLGRGHAKVQCSDCHVVPETVYVKGHVDTAAPAEVILSGLAAQSTREPLYDSKTGSCTNTYCHGNANVNWIEARSEKDACGTCHRLPPALPHPQKKQCFECHGDVIAKDGTWRDAARHVDGRVDVTIGGGCAACHGTDPNTGAPPPDLKGNTKSTALGVGAHEHHLKDSETHRGIACSECHRVPEEVDSAGHIDDDGHAEIVFGTLAKTNKLSPTYLAEQGSCSNTYCHGKSSGNWQAPRNTVDACGGCHGLPPPLPHTQLTTCSNCHGRVVDENQQVIEPSLHVNGKIETDFGQDCSACHGTALNGAPPPDLHGNTATTERGVGAHVAHLVASATHAPLACSECHEVPSQVTDPGHLDGDDRAEVKFGRLAKSHGARPAYDTALSACSNTYCHRSAVVDWLAPRSSDLACGSCHALPPAAPHPNIQDCSKCHGSVIDASKRFIAPERHVNGMVEVSNLACNTCHGSDPSGSPPPDTTGNIAISSPGVGAHERHLRGATTHGPINCTECHLVPTVWNETGHLDSALPAEVNFGTLALANGASPAYVPSATTCTNTYCHGLTTPVWTFPRSESTTCGTCHALPPPAPHPAVTNCSLCHGAVVDVSRNFVNPALHVDGTVQVVQNCAACHGSASNAAPPVDTNGNSSTTLLSVGAHQVHLSGGQFSRPVDCQECHVVPATIEASGHLDVGTSDPADVTFSGTALTMGRSVRWERTSATCTGSYCHGPEDQANRSPIWTASGSNLNCSSCHGMPPASPHTADNRCSRCHSDVDASRNIIDRNLHINGEIDLK